MHPLCRLHGPLGADVYIYSTRKNLQVKPFLLFARFLFTCLMRSPLMVLVSYTELLFTTDFVVEYFVPYIGATFPLVARRCA